MRALPPPDGGGGFAVGKDGRREKATDGAEFKFFNLY